jgi:two-component system NtrC family sensor kinase
MPAMTKAQLTLENERLQQENARLRRDLTEALEQQTATSEILRVISRSPTDVQPVFDAIARSAVRLCDGEGCHVVRFDGGLMHLVASHNPVPEAAGVAFRARFPMLPDRRLGVGRAIQDRAVVHIADITRDAEYDPELRQGAPTRSVLAVPMLRTGTVSYTHSDAADE